MAFDPTQVTTAFGFQDGFQTTLSSAVNSATDLQISLTTLPTPTEGTLVIEPGTANEEEVYFTSLGTGVVNIPSASQGRGVNGTATTHNSGVIVKMLWTKASADASIQVAAKTVASANYDNLVRNGEFINNSTGGYGDTPDDWTASGSAVAIQGGWRNFTKQNLIDFGITDGQIEGFWTLNTTFNDQSSNAYNLTGAGGAATPTYSSSGLMAQSGAFASASSQYASATATDADITGSQTWICYYKPTAVGTAQIIGGFDDAGDTKRKAFVLNANGTVSFTLTGLTTATTIASDVVLEASKWYMLVGKYDSSAQTLGITVNGITKTTTASGTATTASGAFALGRAGSYNASYANGLLQAFMIISTALTASQINQIWEWTTYCGLKVLRNSADGYIYQTLQDDQVLDLRGKTLTLAASMTQNVASVGQIAIYDGSETASSLSTTVGTAETVSVTKVISSTATQIQIRLKVSTSNGSTWFSSVRMYQGSTVFPYKHSPNDWARFPNLLRMNPAAIINGYSYEEGRWYTYTPVWSASGTSPAIGNGTATGRYIHRDKRGKVKVKFDFGSTSTFGTGNYYVSSPFVAGNVLTQYEPIGSASAVDTGSNVYYGITELTNSVLLSVGVPAGGEWTNTIPHTWANTDKLMVHADIEIA